MNANKCVFIGRLLADVTYTPPEGDKSSRANYRIAANLINSEKYDVINCTAWGKLADAAAKFLSKGKEVYVEGALRTNATKNADNSWDNFWSINVSYQSFGRDSQREQRAAGGTCGPAGGKDKLDELAEKLAAQAKAGEKKSDLQLLVEKLMKKGFDQEKATALASQALADQAAQPEQLAEEQAQDGDGPF